MLKKTAEGKCPVCGQAQCGELEQAYGVAAFSSSFDPGKTVAADRVDKVTVTDRVFYGGHLVYTSGDRVDRFHADEMGAMYASDEELTEVSLEEFIKARDNEDKREGRDRPRREVGKKTPPRRRPKAKGSETPNETG